MKITVSIVTYDNQEDLDNNLGTLLESDFVREEFKIEVINNFSARFNINPEFSKYVDIVHNRVRPDWSTGHLARDYNSAIIRHFRNLNTPSIDWLVTSQDDVVWKSNWVEKLKDVQDKYDFITSGVGDCITIYNANAIKAIGIWDERFCQIGHHEHDMYLRAFLWHKDRISINDNGHTNTVNPCDNAKWIFYDEQGNEVAWEKPNCPGRCSTDFIIHPRINEERLRVRQTWAPFAYEGHKYFKHKWGIGPQMNLATDSPPPCQPHPLIPTYMFYPYFEKDISNLQQKGYIVL